MKIGILTLHRALNYGAVLQTMGLYNYLKKMNYQVEIIDFVPNKIYGYYNYKIFSKPITMRSVISKTLRYKRNKKEFKAFEDFVRENLPLSKKCYTEMELKEIINQYDSIICGSDQIWNPKATAGMTNVYYLNFIKNNKIRKISYAASYGNINTVTEIEENLKEYFKSFTAISVREEEAVEKTKQLYNKDVKRLIDPSMLMEKEEYRSKEKEIVVPARYILVYKLKENDIMTNKAIEIAKILNIKIVSLGKKIPNSIFLKTIGPGEFLYLCDHAEYILTNSFHGTVFSLIYNKPFLTFENGNYNSRMETILNITNQQKRMVTKNEKVEKLLRLLINKEDYDFENIIEKELNKSKEFLKKSLEG